MLKQKHVLIMYSAGLLTLSMGVFSSCQKQTAMTPKAGATNDVNQTSAYVSTPFGRVLSSKVHLVENGSEITVINGNLKKINSATGAEMEDYGSALPAPGHINRPFQASSTNNLTTESIIPQSGGGTVGNGYYVYGNLPSGKDINSFSTSWVVPSAPVAGADSTLFLWNGADNQDGNTFMQPVLGWNDGNGQFWFIQNWGYANGNYFHSNYIQVTTGTTVTGVMTQSSAKNGKYKYQITFAGYPSINYTQSYPEPANQVIECWEAYVNNYIYFPPNQYVAMQDMNLQYVGSGTTNQPITWVQTNDGAIATPSGKNTVFQNNGTTNSIVDFYFQ
jgi:hypothetical protein